MYVRGAGGCLMGLLSEILWVKSCHRFWATVSKAEWSGLCSLKLLTTMPRNSCRPRFTPRNTYIWRKIFIYCECTWNYFGVVGTIILCIPSWIRQCPRADWIHLSHPASPRGLKLQTMSIRQAQCCWSWSLSDSQTCHRYYSLSWQNWNADVHLCGWSTMYVLI